MVTDPPNRAEQLLPAKHNLDDLFICDVADAIIKDIMPQMEHPFYSLSKKPQTSIRRYEHNGNWIEITPSVKGQATIYDKDILIYCISQVMEKLKRGEPVGHRLRINSRDLLVFTNRGTGGKDYAAISEAIARLAGTRISTNVKSGGEEEYRNFGLIDEGSVRRKHGPDGRLLWAEIKLSEWIFNAIRKSEVLTLHRDYFRLRKPLERRIYELSRKHCGKQPTWQISLEVLLKKSGSDSPMKRFREMVKHIARHDHLPDYSLAYNEAADTVVFINRGGKWVDSVKPSSPDDESLPPLPSEAYEDGRDAAPGYDIHRLETEWREWWAKSGKPTLGNPAAAFVGFCSARHKQSPIKRQFGEGDHEWT